MTCYKCKKARHYANECWSREKKEPPSLNKPYESVMLCMDVNNHDDHDELPDKESEDDNEDESEDDDNLHKNLTQK